MRMSDHQQAVLRQMTSRLELRDPCLTCATLYLDPAVLAQLQHDEATPLTVEPDADYDTLALS